MSKLQVPHPMTLRLFNTLTGELDALVPMDGEALRMYACGPTVYDYGHIGNFRTFLQIDVLRRFLLLTGTKVRHVMNITDVDDKIIRNAAAAGIPSGSTRQSTSRRSLRIWIRCGCSILRSLHALRSTLPRMVELVQKLAASGAAYQTEDGSWYFRLAAFPEYGKLSKKDLAAWKTALAWMWTSTRKTRPGILRCGRPPNRARPRGIRAIGRGRPGWHIECSAMAMEYLGESFDLHAGGEDLMFPHHENEIAQSEMRHP